IGAGERAGEGPSASDGEHGGTGRGIGDGAAFAGERIGGDEGADGLVGAVQVEDGAGPVEGEAGHGGGGEGGDAGQRVRPGGIEVGSATVDHEGAGEEGGLVQVERAGIGLDEAGRVPDANIAVHVDDGASDGVDGERVAGGAVEGRDVD